MNDQEVIIEIQLEGGELEKNTGEILAGIRDFKTLLTNINQVISKGFENAEKSIQKVEGKFGSLEKSFADTVDKATAGISESINGLAIGLEKIVESITEVMSLSKEQEKANATSNVASKAFDAEFVLLLESIKSTAKDSSSGKPIVKDSTEHADTKGTLMLPAPKNSENNANNANTDGLVSGLAAQMGNLASSGGGMETLAAGLEAVRSKLQEVTQSWSKYAMAKKDDLATDIKIVAGYVGDFAKSIAGTVAHLATSTAAWVGHTAAKVASTAAEWAQIAATTAWQAICVAATAVTTAFGAAISFLTSPIGLVVAAITAVIAVVALLITNWDAVAAKAKEVWGGIQQRFTDFSNFLSGVFAADWSAQFGAFGHVLNGFLDMVEGIFTVVKSIFSGIIGFITGVFSGDWQKAWSSIVGLFKGIWDGVTAVIKVPLNGIIGIINGLLGSACNGINGIIKLLNGLKFTIPDWVPGIGGSSIGFNIKQLTPPQIPYLAKGAVLPANRPFLAVVGDQRHGTNIEAPLATIQEAVAVVMEEHIAAMMAGFQALLEEQRALRQCVESIEVGDDVIGQAAWRYGRKMAMIRGGY